MTRVILVQHCQSEHHVNDMTGGWTDTPLTHVGIQQAESIGTKLKESINSDEYVLYSSDLLRASQTAEIIGKHLGLDVIEDSGLREINTGLAAGKTKNWAREHRNPRRGEGFDLDYQEFEKGETWRQFYDRVCGCMSSLCQTDETKNLLIVTHGGTLGYITAWWMGFDPDMLRNACFSASAGSISVLTTNSFEQRVMEVFNDTAHLALLR